MKHIICLILCVFVIGCEKSSDNKSPAATTPVGKPLPEECAAMVHTAFFWKTDQEALQYRIFFTLPGTSSPFIEMSADSRSNGSQLSLERGSNINVAIEKVLKNGQLESFATWFYIPSCSERVLWRAAHPDYEEPIAFKAKWSGR